METEWTAPRKKNDADVAALTPESEPLSLTVITVDEIEMLAMLLRDEIVDIIQDEFAREMNHLVYEEARHCCEGCQTDDPSQMHHDCMM